LIKKINNSNMSKKSLNGSDFEEVYGNDLITSNQADKKKIA